MNTTSHIPSLTPLRGIAAILVLIFHYDLFVNPLLPDSIVLVDKWYLMVDLFFVLSGFIMYHVYGSWFTEHISRRQFFSYMKARFARIYPLHFFTLLFMIGICSVLWFRVGYSNLGQLEQAIFDPKAIPTSLLMIQAWGFHMTAPLNTASWSISVEFFLYLVFPWIILFLVRYGRPARWIMAGIALFSLLAITFYFSLTAPFVGEYTIGVITGTALLRGMAGFTAGMLVYELYRAGWQKDILKQGHWFWGIWLLLSVLWIKDLLPDVVAVALFALLILHTAHVEGNVKRILNTKVLTFLGNISYSIYMVHMPLILSPYIIMLLMAAPSDGGTVSNAPPNPADPNYLMNWAGVILFSLLVIGVGSLTYRFIEVPMRRKLKRKSYAVLSTKPGARKPA